MKRLTRPLIAAGLSAILVLGACGSPDIEAEDDTATDEATESSQVTNEGDDTATEEDTATENDDTTGNTEEDVSDSVLDDAVERAKERFDGDLEEVELERDDGREVIKVELENEIDEYEVKFDSEDFTVLEEEFERDDDYDLSSNERTAVTGGKDGFITSEEAIEIAGNEVGGYVEEWEFEADDNEYELEFKADGDEWDVEIDAATGDVLDVEQDD